MDDQVKLLKQQVAAAEFLLRNLRTQLREAEERAASRRSEGDAGNVQDETTGGNVEGARPNPAAAESGQRRMRNGTLFNNIAQAGGEGDELDASEDDDDEAPGETTEGASQFQLPSIEVGTVFPTLEDIKKAVTAHAISQGWTCGVNKRDKTRIVLRCRTGTSCPFHIRAEQYATGARICSLKPQHNCSFQPDQSHVPRSHASTLKFLRQQLPNIMTVDANTTAQEISDAIFQRFSTRVSVKQCRKLKAGPKRKRAPSMSTCGKCGGVGHNRTTCGRVSELQQTPSE